MNIPSINIELTEPPNIRWKPLESFAVSAKKMLYSYVEDLGGIEQFDSLLKEFTSSIIPKIYLDELKSISEIIDCPLNYTTIANLYYDAMKVVLGCTAFAVNTDNGPVHSRNLDWWSDNGALSKETIIINYLKNGVLLYKVIGWPGFIGALSGMVPNKFSLTLNAVISDDPIKMGIPITLLLREVLENSSDYIGAKNTLESTQVVSDSLILLSGTKKDEMCVIERTPSRFATRESKNGYIIVTNNYQKLEIDEHIDSSNPITESSCARYEATEAFLKNGIPDDFFEILENQNIKMNITAQHMVMVPNLGSLVVKLPALSDS